MLRIQNANSEILTYLCSNPAVAVKYGANPRGLNLSREEASDVGWRMYPQSVIFVLMAKRGQYSLFTEIFEQEKPRTEDTRPRNYFMPIRNEHLAYRYYYYAEIRCYRYSKCLEILEREFYLTEARLVVVLSELADQLKQINQLKPGIKELRDLIPHLNWKQPETVV